MNVKLKGFRWPVHKAIDLIEHHYDVDSLYPVDRNKIMLDCGCGVATLNRAIKAVRVKRMLILSELSVTHPDFQGYTQIFILKSTIDTLKGHVKYLLGVSGRILKGQSLDKYDEQRLAVIEKIGGVAPEVREE